MALGLRHTDSLVNLSKFLEEHHDQHNVALDSLLDQNVGDSAEVDVGLCLLSSDSDDSESEKEEATTTDDDNNKDMMRKGKQNKEGEGETLSAKPVTATVQEQQQPRRPKPTASSSSDKNTTPTATTADYYEEDYYPYYDPYAPTEKTQAGRPIEQNYNILSCIFPWINTNRKASNNNIIIEEGSEVHDRDETSEAKKKNNPHQIQQDKDKREETETETTSRTTTITTKTSTTATKANDNTGSKLLSEQQQTSSPTTGTIMKGILKKPQVNRISRDNKMNEEKTDDCDSGNKSTRRRALFSTMYVAEGNNKNSNDNKSNNEVSSSSSNNNKKKIEFSPFARVLTVDSHEDYTHEEKREIWWQKKDFTDFRKTSQFVTKAMLQKGSEVWLMTNPSWNSGHHNNEEKKDDDSDKWWCKFGHSRRGLEHVTCPEEGRERQRNVLQSIHAVVKEQKRQRRMYGLVNNNNSNNSNNNSHSPKQLRLDDQRIRSAYIRYNSWARELCLAAGASDAEAIRSNFKRGSCRDHYLSKLDTSTITGTVPSFIQRKSMQMSIITTEAIHDAPATNNCTSLSKKAVGFGLNKITHI